MSDATQLLVSFASTTSAGCHALLPSLALPNLQRLLARLSPDAFDEGSAHDLSPPHERVLARAAGLYAGDGRIPWAASQLRGERGDRGASGDIGNTAWAWITPCHWAVGRDHITMHDPAQLRLEAAEAQALLDAMQPYFVQDGLTLQYKAPTTWLAQGEVLRGLACASLDRVAGRSVDAWLPRGPDTSGLRRLQQEMQMLLYTHPVNAEREQRGLLPVNSFWVSGAGALPADARTPPRQRRSDHRLKDAALAEDWQAWAAAWRELDAKALPRLLEALDRGPVSLTLCGERHARTWSAASGRWWHKLAASFRSPSIAATLEAL